MLKSEVLKRMEPSQDVKNTNNNAKKQISSDMTEIIQLLEETEKFRNRAFKRLVDFGKGQLRSQEQLKAGLQYIVAVYNEIVEIIDKNAQPKFQASQRHSESKDKKIDGKSLIKIKISTTLSRFLKTKKFKKNFNKNFTPKNLYSDPNRHLKPTKIRLILYFLFLPRLLLELLF